MTTAFPTTFDNFTNPTSSNDLNTPGVLHADQHANANDAIEAIEAILGITNSAVTTSINYRLRDIESGLPYNVAKLSGAVGDGATNDYAAFEAARASSAKYVIVPYTSTGYYLSGATLDLTGKVWISQGGWTKLIADTALTSDLCKIDGDDTTLKGFILDGNYVSHSATAALFIYSGSDGLDIDIRIINAKGFGIYCQGVTNSRFRVTTANGQNSGIEVDGSGNYGNTFEDYHCTDNLGMGIRVTGGAHDNLFTRLYTTSNTLELIGITYDCANNKVSFSIAQGCGDNGFSISQRGGSVCDLTAKYNDNNGICIYGSLITGAGLTAIGNNQSASGFSGVVISAGYGGEGYGNNLVGVNSYDDQAVPTQRYGFVFGGNNYSAYDNGTTYATRSFVTNASKVYVSTTSIASGGGAPTHSSGTTAGWKYLYTTSTNFHATGNVVSNLSGYGNTLGLYGDDATSGSNTLSQQVMGSLGVKTPADGTYTLVASAPYAGMINSIRGLATSSGTLTGAVKINGTNVTSLSGLSVTSTPQNATASAANTFVKGDRITLVVSSNSSGADLEATLELLRMT